MKSIISVVVLVFLFVLQSFAQEESQKAMRYFGSVNSGLLTGERMKSITFSASTVHGISINERFRLGGGIGIDSYDDVQAFPIFGHVAYDVFKLGNGNSLFIQGNYGWAHAWDTNNISDYYVYPEYSRSGGKSLQVMLGYRVNAGKLELSFSGGYKYQETRSITEWPPVNYSAKIFVPQGSTNEAQNFDRVIAQIGIGWH